MKNIYTNIYSDENNLGDLASSIRIKKMLDIVNDLNPQNKKILDIGCYDGTFLSLVRNRNNSFYGLETNAWSVDQSRKKNIKIQQFYFDDEAKFPYENDFFDVIVAGEIIEHIFDTDFFLGEVRRVLKPGGHLIISTPNIASLGRRLFLLFGLNPIIEISPNEPDSSGHIRYFTFRTLKKLLKKSNFRVIGSRSDYLNFSKDGKIKSVFLSKIFPKLGTSIILTAKK